MVIPVPTWAWQCRSPPNGVEIAWRRHQTTKCGTTHKVKLAKGNFITEYPVPTPVHSTIEAKYAMTSTTEFLSVFLVSNSLTTWTLIKLQTATCSIALHNMVDPDDFSEASQWTLRTKLYNHQTDLLIAVTSYNEDKTLYARTFHSVMLDIHDICKTT